MSTFTRANILLPKTDDLESWAVIACDQFTSEPEYWERVKKNVKDKPSTLNLILPEAFMDKKDNSAAIENINSCMKDYLEKDMFTEYRNAYIYVERTLVDGSIRKGIVGAVDLECYDYSADASTDIRATEKTVEERIPPRMEIRKNAPLELPHILLLCNDDKFTLIDSVEAVKNNLKQVYDFDLMENGGNIKGWLVDGEYADMLDDRIAEYEDYCREKYLSTGKAPLLYATGDGNHSLATAKACYEKIKKSNANPEAVNLARYAILELGNIMDDSQQIEPIHRVVTGTDTDKLLEAVKKNICAESGYPVTVCIGENQCRIFIDKQKGELPIAILQKYLDEYLSENEGEIDYIHGIDSVKNLSKPEGAIGFILPEFDKGSLFTGIVKQGVLPRKTFSMGHANEKRYYLEARVIR